MGWGFAGGIVVAILVSFLLPVMEGAFNIVTDVRLLELSNLDNPLLRRLAVEAPGSYNHSVIVGTLAEAAAEAIGANALFCRVAAYYHDVGKMLKPEYFIENQRRGANRHDRLSPHLSALVIASHVKEGYELARSYGLPRQVLDIIPQHHGTRKINFFYQKGAARRTAGAASNPGVRLPLSRAQAADPGGGHLHAGRLDRGGGAHARGPVAGPLQGADSPRRVRRDAGQPARRERHDLRRPGEGVRPFLHTLAASIITVSIPASTSKVPSARSAPAARMTSRRTEGAMGTIEVLVHTAVAHAARCAACWPGCAASCAGRATASCCWRRTPKSAA
jgi:putative nucleotidyltransferase with HDIG domain